VADFHLPSFGVQGSDLGRGERGMIQQGGQDPDRCGLDPAAEGAGGNGEAHQPRGRVREPGSGLVTQGAAPLAEHPVRFAEPDQLGPVGQGFQGLERDGLGAVLDPPAQVRPGAGEPQPPVHGEEPPVCQVQHPRLQRPGELIDKGVLPVGVAAHRSADPAAGPGPHVRDDPQLGLGAALGYPERIGQDLAGEQLRGGAVERGGLHPVPQRPDPQVRVRAGGIKLEQAPHHVLTQERPGFRQRRAGRDRGAGLDGKPGQPERGRQDRIVATPGEQAPHDQADHRHLRVQRPVQLMIMRCGRDRLVDHPVREQLLEQAPAVEFVQPARPQARPGQDPAGKICPQALLLPGIR
jgi:hypothetical protein